MICKPCRNRNHEDCPGGSHCPCQHLGSGVRVLTKDDRHALVLADSKPAAGDRSLLTIRPNGTSPAEEAPC